MDITKFLLNYYEIPPDRMMNNIENFFDKINKIFQKNNNSDFKI